MRSFFIFLKRTHLAGLAALAGNIGLWLIAVSPLWVNSYLIGILMLTVFDLSLLTLFSSWKKARLFSACSIISLLIYQSITIAGSRASLYLIGSGDLFIGNLFVLPALILVGFLLSRAGVRGGCRRLF